MKKTIITLAVLFVISLICTVCFGTALGSQAIVGFFRDDGVLDSWVDRVEDWGEAAVRVNDLDDILDEGSKAYLFDSKEVELSAGDTLFLDVDCGDVRILRGTDDTVKATLEQYSKRNNPTTKYELKVENESTLRLTAQSNTRGVSARLTVYLPQQLSDLRVEVDIGDVYLENLAADALSVQLDTGDLDLKNVTADTLSVKLNTGDLDLERITAKNIALDVKTGDIDIDRSVTASEALTLDCACGDVDFELPETAPFSLEYTVRMGDAEIDSSVRQEYIRSVNRSGAQCEGTLARTASDAETASVITLRIDVGDLEIKADRD